MAIRFHLADHVHTDIIGHSHDGFMVHTPEEFLEFIQAAAATATDYKALVCVFLFGGNDANNTVVPVDTSGYANYSAIRGPLALPQADLISLPEPDGTALADE